MIVSKILILFLPLLLLAEANFGTGPFHRSPPASTPSGLPTISSNLPVNQRIPPPKLPHHDQQITPSVHVVPVTVVYTEKSVSVEPTTLPPKIDTDSPIEIQTLKPGLIQPPNPFHIYNINQNTSPYHVPKSVVSPWSQPKFPTPSVNIHKPSQPDTVESVHIEPIIVVTPEKSVSVNPSNFSPKIDTDSPIKIQTLKSRVIQQSHPFDVDNIHRDTSPDHVSRPVLRNPWSPPKIPKPTVNIQKPFQPNTSPLVHVESFIEKSTEKSVSVDPATLPPKKETPTPIDIPAPKPAHRFHTDYMYLDTSPYHVPKPVSSPWTPPKFDTVPSVNIHPYRASQPNSLQFGHVSHASYVYQTPPTVSSVPKNETLVSVDPSNNRKKFSTDELLGIQTPETSLSNSLHPEHPNFIPRPAPSPRISNKPTMNSSEKILSASQLVHTDKRNWHKENGPYHRLQRSADHWDQHTFEDQISPNNSPPPALTTERPGSNLHRFMCPQAYGYFKFSNQCEEYIECKNYIPLAYTCPTGLYFNPRANWTEYPCDHPSNVQCDKESIPLPTTASPPTTTLPSEEVTTPRPNNQKHNYRCPQPHGYFKISDQCEKYIECKNYVALMFSCPAGLHFNPHVEWTAYPCEHPSIVQCDSEPSDEKTTKAPTTTAIPPTPSIRPPPSHTTRLPPPPTTRPPPPPTTRSPPPPPTSRQPPPPPTTRRPPPPPHITWRPPPPTTRKPPPPPPTTKSPPPPPPTTKSPPPPPTTKSPPPAPPTTRRPPPPPITWRPRPPTTRPPPPTTRQPPPPPSTTRSPPPPTTRPPTPPPTTSPLPVITPGSKSPPDYNICLQQFGYFRFSDQCGEYIECKHYVPLIFTCPVGLHFNPLADWREYPCDLPSKVQCNEELADPKVPSTTQPPPASITQSPVETKPQPGSKLLDFKCPEAHGYFEHNDQCSEYIECKNFKAIQRFCPAGLHFDSKAQWPRFPCDYPSIVQCDKEPSSKQPTEHANVTPKPTGPTVATPRSTAVTPYIPRFPTQGTVDHPTPPPSRPPVVPRRSTIATPAPAIVTQSPPAVTPYIPRFPTQGTVDLPTPPPSRPPVVPRRSTIATPAPIIVTQSPTTVTPYKPRFPTQGTVRPSTERPSFELIDYYCREPNGYYAVASQCDTYIECKSNNAIQHFCPAGLHFNPKAQWPNFPCDYPSRVQCKNDYVNDDSLARPTIGTPRPTIATSRRPTGPVITRLPREPTPKSPSNQSFNYSCPESNGFYSIASQCDAYVECKDGIAIEHLCPDGLLFNTNAHWPDYPCGYPSEVTCSSGDVVQQPNPTAECLHREGFFPTDNDDCGEYIVCHAGVATIEHCPPGLVFNFDKLNTCDWPINVPACNQARELEGFVCPSTPINDNALHVHKYRYGHSCKNFIACQKGHPRLLTCDAGLHFNEETESCVDSDLVMDCDA